jgi:hypothetical protein
MNWHIDQKRISDYQLCIFCNFCPIPSVKDVILDGQCVTWPSCAFLMNFLPLLPSSSLLVLGTYWKMVVIHGEKIITPKERMIQSQKRICTEKSTYSICQFQFPMQYYPSSFIVLYTWIIGTPFDFSHNKTRHKFLPPLLTLKLETNI